MNTGKTLFAQMDAMDTFNRYGGDRVRTLSCESDPISLDTELA